MTDAQRDRYGAATGIIFVILVIIGFLIVLPKPPDVDSSAAVFGRYFADNQSDIQVATTLLGVGLFFYIWFLGSLRAGLRAAEGGNGRLWGVAFGGGLVTAVFFLVALICTQAAAFRPDEVDPGLTRALNDIAIIAIGPAAAAFTALFAAPALVILRTGALSAGVGWLCALAAVTQPLAYGVGVTTTGAFAGDGALGLYIPLITFLVGILALSVGLMQRAETAPGSP